MRLFRKLQSERLGETVCLDCKGSGRVIVSVPPWLSTDPSKIGRRVLSVFEGVRYRRCNQCSGRGWVGADRAHYTTDPDKSLEIARQLIRRHGSPGKISLENKEDRFADARLLFQDGFQALLGGFAVGHSGMGPNYLRAMLQDAGFNVTEEEIVKTSLPAHFTRQIEKEQPDGPV